MSHDAGYFDLQVNGYAGVDFNRDDLSLESLHHACQQLQNDGVSSILATIITNYPEQIRRCLEKIVELRQSDPLIRNIIHGFHIEGPFLNEEQGYVGAHLAAAVCPADPDLMKQLLDAAHGLTRLVTLAPERDENYRVTRLLADQGIRVAAGHCNPSLDQLNAAIDAGLTMFTHLGNGCPQSLPRHDNIIQRVLSLSDRLWISFIADGVHVPFYALNNYLRCAGLNRCVIVTDAISAAGLGPGTYSLGNKTVMVDENLITHSPDNSYLVGSSTPMMQMADNLHKHLELSNEQIRLLTITNPRKVLSESPPPKA